jgi:hypothetical protein
MRVDQIKKLPHSKGNNRVRDMENICEKYMLMV